MQVWINTVYFKIKIVSFFGSQQLYPLHTKKKKEPNKDPTSPKLRITKPKARTFIAGLKKMYCSYTRVFTVL